jgi:UDP-galactopyranose mutase
MRSDKVGIVGAGLAGAVLARQLAENAGVGSVVFEAQDHVGGNCHTRRDERTGVMVHEHGPHIFNTPHIHVWDWIRRFAEFGPYVHRARATTDRGVFGLPINLLTINQFFGTQFTPNEARAFAATLGNKDIVEPKNFEEKALQLIGPELYANFFEGYTTKQWGRSPKELPAYIFSRLPISFTYDDKYHVGPYTGIPLEGYTAMIAAILDHPDIEVRLDSPAEPAMRSEFRHLFWSGTIDGFFEEKLGRLRYRSMQWDHRVEKGDIIGCTQMNFPSLGVPHTRITEYKHFAPWEEHEESIAFIETPKETEPGDAPHYPLGLDEDRALFDRYRALAEDLSGVSFIGRLGTYRYLDMDKVINEMLEFSEHACMALTGGDMQIPVVATPD